MSLGLQPLGTRVVVGGLLAARRAGVAGALLRVVGGRVLTYRCSHGLVFRAWVSDYWRFVGREGHYEPLTTGFLEEELGEDDVFVDVGAHIGIHSVHAARRAWLVVAVEPVPANASLLRENVLRNRVLGRVEVVEAAACDYDGPAYIYLDKRSSGGHTLEPLVGRPVLRTTCLTLENILAGLGVFYADVVKIDVEGAEERVLKGMGAYIETPRAIVVETTRDIPLKEMLEEHGYRFRRILDVHGERVNALFVKKR